LIIILIMLSSGNSFLRNGGRFLKSSKKTNSFSKPNGTTCFRTSQLSSFVTHKQTTSNGYSWKDVANRNQNSINNFRTFSSQSNRYTQQPTDELNSHSSKSGFKLLSVFVLAGGIIATAYLVTTDEIFAEEKNNNKKKETAEKEKDSAPQRKKRSRIIFVLGPPGSGKKTMCEKISTDYGYVHLSITELLKKEIDGKTELANEITESIKKTSIFSRSSYRKTVRKCNGRKRSI